MGLESIAVGRERELTAMTQDLDTIADGGATFRFVVGRYGAGKSFLLQLLRNRAMEQGFVVADVDLSPQLRLAGSKNQALATYRELMKNLATRTHANGGASALILEKWISSILNQVARDTGKQPGEPEFDSQVEGKIREVVEDLEGLVHGFDFANIIVAYWRGYREDNTALKDAALRWLRGEFSGKTEAKNALGTRVIIDDDTWYDYIKLFAKFSADLGYKGLIIFLDEAVHLYKVSNAKSRQANYDKLLAMFNDAMQGKAEYLGIVVGGTPEFIEDKRRGLQSDEAWKTRLVPSRFLKSGLRDFSTPTVRLEALTTAEITQLLQRLNRVRVECDKSIPMLSAAQIKQFQQAATNRLGADKLITPREILRDYITILNLLQQNPEIRLEQLLSSSDFQLLGTDAEEDDYTLSL